MIRLVKCGCFIALVLLISSVSFGQPRGDTYLKFDYVKVQPNDVQQYMEYMANTWKPLYQKQVNSGKIDSWNLYRVFTPGGARGAYNFVAIITADSLDPFESFHPRDLLLMEKNSRDRINKMMRQANSLRTIMFTEIWKKIIQMEKGQASPYTAKYMAMDFMMVNPGKDYEYEMLEDELAKPIQQERKDRDAVMAWEVFSLITPGGADYGYNYATPNYYEELGNVEYGFTNEVIRTALPGTNISELFETIFDTRTLVKSEIWELVDRTE